VRLGSTVVLLLVLVLGVAGPAQAAPAPLTEPVDALDRAVECGDGVEGAAVAPVILVHGTGSTPEENFSFGYQVALPKHGHPVCTVRLPERALVDLQRSMQYVVHAVRVVARRSGRRVSLIGHSQGALHAVYASHFWDDLPALIDDVVGLAGPYEGTQRANESCADGRCPVTSWQFRRGSRLNGAFAAAPRPAGPAFTAVATEFDELVTPAPEAALLDGAQNIVIQEICPGRPVDHYAIAGDAVAYAVALDALRHPGPADRSRIDPAVCTQTAMPDGDPVATAVIAPQSIANAALAVASDETVGAEPPLVCPFDRAACGPAAASARRAGAPRLRLGARCLRGGRLRVRLLGDVDAVRDVNFKLGRRLVARDVRPPFVRVVGRRALRRTEQTRLRAVAYLRDGDPFRVIVARALPRCGA
jgi:triacylglycerol lipase